MGENVFCELWFTELQRKGRFLFTPRIKSRLDCCWAQGPASGCLLPSCWHRSESQVGINYKAGFRGFTFLGCRHFAMPTTCLCARSSHRVFASLQAAQGWDGVTRMRERGNWLQRVEINHRIVVGGPCLVQQFWNVRLVPQARAGLMYQS